MGHVGKRHAQNCFAVDVPRQVAAGGTRCVCMIKGYKIKGCNRSFERSSQGPAGNLSKYRSVSSLRLEGDFKGHSVRHQVKNFETAEQQRPAAV